MQKCEYCESMRDLRLPDHSTELCLRSYDDCETDGNKLSEWIMSRFDSVNHDLGSSTWGALRHVRKEHVKYHRENGGTCSVYAEITGRLSESEILAAIA